MPHSLEQLLYTARQLAGKNLGSLMVQEQSTKINNTTSRLTNKGVVGHIIEAALCLTPNSRPGPDFATLGVEVKGIPVDEAGIPLESTFICVVQQQLPLNFVDSLVWKKMTCILWVPYEGDTRMPLAERRIGTPFLWSPDPVTRQMLEQDWTELTEMMRLGQQASLSAHLGQILQIRPKALNARIQQQKLSCSGDIISSGPKGFYLRRNFTCRLFEAVFQNF
ncbi:MAG: MutH/Sau3AI family endonuclease [Pseudomonadota bacterium]